MGEVPAEVQHGKRWTYQKYKCRCDQCSAANRTYMRLHGRKRRGSFVGYGKRPNGWGTIRRMPNAPYWQARIKSKGKEYTFYGRSMVEAEIKMLSFAGKLPIDADVYMRLRWARLKQLREALWKTLYRRLADG